MTTSNRVTDYILKRTGTTLGQLEGVVVSAGLTLDELYTALETVHRDKRITRRVIKGEIVYTPTPEPKAPTDYLKYVRENYPPMTKENDGSGIEADFSYLFLSPEELDKYKAEVQGRAYIPKKRYETKNRTRNSQRDTPTLTETQRALLATRTEHV
jgi:hypothetical protein